MKKTIIAVIGFASAVIGFQASAAGIPALKLVPGCEACTLPGDVAQAFHAGYAKAAGNPASFEGEIEVTITEYTSRNGAARFLMGALSGKDKIAATVTVNGETVKSEDTARSMLCGIDCVAGNVGEQLGKLLVGIPPATPEASTAH